MRKILSVLLTVCILLSTVAVFPISLSAAGGEPQICGDNLTWEYDSYTQTLTISGTGAMTNWASSSNVPWYSFRKSIQTVVIGNSVTSISDDTFRSCSSLTAVTIGNSVTSIGSCAFEDCTSLTKVTVPDSVTSIGDYAFSGCTNLSSATIGNSVKTIGNYSFYNCTNLTEINYNAGSVADFTSLSNVFYNAGASGGGVKVTFGNNVKKIPAYLFYVDDPSCGPKITNVTIGSSVESVGNNAFSDCSSLTSVNITDIKAWCKIRFTSSFSNPLHFAHKLYLNGELVTNLVIPDSVTSIGESAFYQCTSLSSVTIGNSVASIGDFAFWDCKSLTKVTLPDDLKSIGNSAFGNCKSLTKVTIGNSVTSIGNFAFLSCDKLTISCYPGSYAQTYAINNNIPYVLLADITSLSIKSLPAKTVYPIYGTLKTDGLVLKAVLDNGTVCDITTGYTIGDHDLSTPGEKVITVTFMDVTATFTVTVDADLVEYPESAHPYSENSNETWTYTHKTAAESLEITFSSDTETESGWDYIYIYDKDGNEIGCYSGTQLAGQTVTVPGNSFSIKLTSDGSSQYYGFAIDNIKANGAPQEAKRGDLNGDGKVNASDMAILKKVIVGKVANTEYADVNSDGKTNAADMALLKKIIVGKA